MKAAMRETGASVADVSRKTGIPYHAIDKLLKREGATTCVENAVALAAYFGRSVTDFMAPVPATPMLKGAA